MFQKNKTQFFTYLAFILLLIGAWSTFGTVLFYLLEKRPHDMACYDAKREAEKNTIVLRNSLISYIKINASTSKNLTEVSHHLNDLMENYADTVIRDYWNGYQGNDCIEYSSWNIPNIFLLVVSLFFYFYFLFHLT